MTTIVAFIVGILLKVVADDVLDLLAWTARKVLSGAARLDARFAGEADLLFCEWNERMENLPGKIAKLCFALGMFFGVALVHRMEHVFAIACVGFRRRMASIAWRDVAWFCFMGLAIVAIIGMFVTIAWQLASVSADILPGISAGGGVVGSTIVIYVLRIVGGLLIGARHPWVLWVREEKKSDQPIR